MTFGFVEEILRYRSGFRLRTPAPLTPAKRLKLTSSRMTFGSLSLHCKSIPPQERRKIHPQILLCLRTSAQISGIPLVAALLRCGKVLDFCLLVAAMRTELQRFLIYQH
jgi:hypothetical protein